MPEGHLGWAHVARYRGRVGPPLSALERFLVSIFCPTSSFSLNIDVVFFPDLISCKNSQKGDFAKNSVRFNRFIQIWEDSGTNYEAKCLEK